LRDSREEIQHAEEIHHDQEEYAGENEHQVKSVVVFQVHENRQNQARFYRSDPDVDDGVEGTEVKARSRDCQNRQNQERTEHLKVSAERDNMMFVIVVIVCHRRFS